MSIQSEIDRLSGIKADLKAAINGSGSTVGDVFADYPPAVSNGRAGIAAAITEKGVQTPADAPFDVLQANVRAISSKPILLKSIATTPGGTTLYLPQEYSPDLYSAFVAFIKEPDTMGLGTLDAIAYFSDLDLFQSIGEDMRADEGRLDFDGEKWVLSTTFLGFGNTNTEWDFYAL